MYSTQKFPPKLVREFLDNFKPMSLSSPECIPFYDKSSNNAFPQKRGTVRVTMFILDADS